MEDLIEERRRLDEEWEKLRLAREAFEKERETSGVEFKLFVGNLNESSGEVEVRPLFEMYGAVKEVFMLKEANGESKRSCFVKYYSKRAAEDCINALNGKVQAEESRNTLVVRYAKSKGGKDSAPPSSRPMHVGPVMPAVPYPPMIPVAVPAPVAPQYQYPSSASPRAPYPMAVPYPPAPYPPYPYPGYPPVAPPPPVYAQPVHQPHQTSDGPPGANIYANNLSGHATEQEVMNLFSPYGRVISLRILPGEAGRQYSFVSYDNPSSAQAAVNAVNGMVTDGGRRLEVCIKAERGVPPRAGIAPRYAPY